MDEWNDEKWRRAPLLRRREGRIESKGRYKVKGPKQRKSSGGEKVKEEERMNKTSKMTRQK